MKPPEFLGPYRIGETLGKGGMGYVYKAKHERSGDEVAVKLISAQMSEEMRFRRRFDTEIKTLKLLSHPNIVKLIGFGEEQGMLFYSMEYVSGETLQEMIRRDKKLHWMTALEIAIQVCAALKHAHDIGVTHRDLKPANLIVSEDGTVKLLDFGISKIFGHDQTAVGSIMGTADYMAPEQANESGVTSRTDLFALGCVIYAMLCGKSPHRGKNITEVLSAVQFKDPVPLDLIDPDLPDDVVQIVNELLEKRPENRPPTALAVMNRLKAMRAGLHRMQTLADKVDDQPGDKSSGDTTRKRRKRPGEGNNDTTASREGVPESQKTSIEMDKTRAADTVPFLDFDDSAHTAVAKVDPSAGTIYTEGREGNRGTVLGTGVTAPVEPDASQVGPGSESAISNDSFSSDTSAGSTGKTHFQTVSEGEVREGFFASPEAKTEHPALRVVSIALLVLVLLIGGAMMIRSLRGPTAEELLAGIENPAGETQEYEIQDEIERFLKLFPGHPKTDELIQRQMAFRVEAAVRRLRLKAKLRTSEGPLYEQAFLAAMDLRNSDPAAAREKLDQWVDVFQDSTMDDEDEPLQLAELARFESNRLASISKESDGSPGDPKLAELMQRIENAKQLPIKERTRLLEGIVTLYEGQPWAESARQLAIEMLNSK